MASSFASDSTVSTRRPSRVITVPIWARGAPSDLINSSEQVLDSSEHESIIEIPRNVSIASSAKIEEKDRWWSFTLPHRNPDALDSNSEKGKTKEVINGSTEEDYFGSTVHGNSNSSRPQSIRSNFQQNHSKLSPRPAVATPGWSSPWKPFERPHRHHDPFLLMTEKGLVESKKSKFRKLLLESPFTPLVFRTFNLALNAIILFVAVKILLQERQNDIRGIIGTSKIFAIVISPFAMIHIVVVLYLEYFGLPIGLWKMHVKMQHVLYELVFICLWSSTLSLSFHDLLVSPLNCSSYTPFARYILPLSSIILETNLTKAVENQLCEKQRALVGLVFISVGFYITILVVSLFRIFDKVNRK